jgi:glycosyltransferase involved in cell wall biosynthesis
MSCLRSSLLHGSMNIWLVTTGEPAPIGFCARDRLLRTGSLAAFLAEKDHDVTWWTSTFDHARKVHLFTEDTQFQVKERMRLVLLHGCGYKRNVSFSRIQDHRIVAKRFAQRVRQEKEKPDIILASLPTIELCFESVSYGRDFRIPVVLDMRDMWPDILAEVFPGGIKTLVRLALSPAFRMAQRGCQGATAITGITDEFVAWGVKKAGRPKAPGDRSFPLGYTSEPPAEGDVRQAENFWNDTGVLNSERSFNVCFLGTLGRQLDVGTIILAARKIREQGIPINFILCGDGERFDSYQKMTRRDKNVILPGRVDAARIFALMRRSFIGLDPLPDRYDFLATINNKAIEYFSSGLPVISSPDRGVLAEFLENHRCGLSYPTGDSDCLVSRMLMLYHDRELLREMSDNARNIFRDKFTSERVNRDWMDYLETIASQHAHYHG